MWPLLALSLVAVSVVLERVIFTLRERSRRQRAAVTKMLTLAEQGSMDEAQSVGAASTDFIARTLTFALAHRDASFSNALLQASAEELYRYQRGLAVLDTTITLAPLLGLFGTITGMIHSFGLLGASELSAPTAITGGIAEALMATAFGLVIAMIALIPFNFLNSQLEQARHDIETSAAQLERLLLRTGETVA